MGNVEDPKYDNNWLWVGGGTLYVVVNGRWHTGRMSGPRLNRPHSIIPKAIYLPKEYMT